MPYPDLQAHERVNWAQQNNSFPGDSRSVQSCWRKLSLAASWLDGARDPTWPLAPDGLAEGKSGMQTQGLRPRARIAGITQRKSVAVGRSWKRSRSGNEVFGTIRTAIPIAGPGPGRDRSPHTASGIGMRWPTLGKISSRTSTPLARSAAARRRA